MSDFRDDEEEERYIRRIARRMPIRPDRIARHLDQHGFVLTYANREKGINQIDLLRPSPTLIGLFDIIHLKSGVRGGTPSVEINISVIPEGHGNVAVTTVGMDVPATQFGFSKDHPDLKTSSDSKIFERQLADVIPELFIELSEGDGRQLHDATARARRAAERYLTELRPTKDLHETLARLRKTASAQQWDRSQHYVNNEFISTFNLKDFRVVSDIAGLCQILYWEDPDADLHGLREVYYEGANPDDIEAHRRFHLVASRLAREPGWPIVDPLVPSRNDELDDLTPWREGKPSQVAQLFDEHLASNDKNCKCGKALHYLRHSLRKDIGPPVAQICVRCNNGHEEIIEIAEALQALL
jgi:hypothetical protein